MRKYRGITAWSLLLVPTLLVTALLAAPQQPDPNGTEPFVPTQPMRVQLPTDSWHNGPRLAQLPPPRDWVSAEMASLGRTMGSSPESEPLDPGDELTMDTGRIASHKNGFFQKLAISSAWIYRDGDQNLGLIENEAFVTVALPLPSRDYPLLITTGFDLIQLDGPQWPDLPVRLYDAYLDFMWLPKLSERWMGIFSLAPGVYSDFDSLQEDAFRLKAKALARFDWVPGQVQVLFGILYLNRDDVNWLPAGGIIWDPHDDVHLELVFPRPKLAYRFTSTGLFEDWVYLAGEFGGDTWSIRRGPDTFDMITYVDWRAFLGVERVRPGGAAMRLEAGYVFGRELQFASATPDATFGNTFMVRAGIDF